MTDPRPDNWGKLVASFVIAGSLIALAIRVSVIAALIVLIAGLAVYGLIWGIQLIRQDKEIPDAELFEMREADPMVGEGVPDGGQLAGTDAQDLLADHQSWLNELQPLPEGEIPSKLEDIRHLELQRFMVARLGDDYLAAPSHWYTVCADFEAIDYSDHQARLRQAFRQECGLAA